MCSPHSASLTLPSCTAIMTKITPCTAITLRGESGISPPPHAVILIKIGQQL